MKFYRTIGLVILLPFMAIGSGILYALFRFTSDVIYQTLVMQYLLWQLAHLASSSGVLTL